LIAIARSICLSQVIDCTMQSRSGHPRPRFSGTADPKQLSWFAIPACYPSRLLA